MFNKACYDEIGKYKLYFWAMNKNDMINRILSLLFLIAPMMVIGQFTQTSVANTHVVSTTADSNKVYTLTANGLYVSSDYGVSYSNITTLPTIYNYNVVSYNKNTGVVYLATEGNISLGSSAKVMVSNDRAVTWNTLTIPSLSSIYINQIYIKGNAIFIATSENGVLKSTNNGSSWTSMVDGLPKFYGDTTKFEGVVELYLEDNILYSGTYKDGVYVWNDNLTVWEERNNGISKNIHGNFSEVADIFFNDGRFFRGLRGDSYHFSDDTLRTHQYFSEFFAPTPFFIEFAKFNNTIYCSVENYIYYSTDNGVNWKRFEHYFSSGITTFNANDNGLVVGTQGEGVWTWAPGTASVNEYHDLIVGFAVYPNPTANMITIQLNNFNDIPDDVLVTINTTKGVEVYNSLLYQTKTSIDLSTLSKGNYIVKLSTLNSGDIFTKKIVKQ